MVFIFKKMIDPLIDNDSFGQSFLRKNHFYFYNLKIKLALKYLSIILRIYNVRKHNNVYLNLSNIKLIETKIKIY